MPGQASWASRYDGAAAIGEFGNNPILQKQMAREAREGTVWGDLATDKVLAPSGNGMFDAQQDVKTSGVIWRQQIGSTAGTDEARFSFRKRIYGAGTLGDAPVAMGDYNEFLHDSVKINIIDSPAIPIPTEMNRRRGYNIVSDYQSLVREDITIWHSEQYAIDATEALLRGASRSLLSTEVGGLGLDILGVAKQDGTTPSGYAGAGSQALHELIYMPATADGAPVAYALPDSSAASRTTYENSVAVALKALQTAGTANANTILARQGLRAIYQIASQRNIMKIKGSDFDYIFVCDWAIADGLIAASGTNELREIWKYIEMGKGDASSLIDARKRLVMDGVLIVPDRMLQNWRPCTLTGVASPNASNIVYGGTSGAPAALTLAGDFRVDKRNQPMSSVSAVGFLLGQGAILEAYDGGISIYDKKGDFEKDWSAQGRAYRGMKRALWKSKTGGTAVVQNTSIQFFFNVASNLKFV